MKAIPARPMAGPTASTSWLPAGPTTATMLELEMNCWVTVIACAGLSCVSPWISVIFVLFAALSIATASCAKCSCSLPSGATGPVIGPSNPTDATHDLVAADALRWIRRCRGGTATAAATTATSHGERANRRRGKDQASLHWIRLHFRNISRCRGRSH